MSEEREEQKGGFQQKGDFQQMSQEELQKEFKQLQIIYNGYETNSSSQIPHEDTINRFNNLQTQIQKQNMFSPNETIEDVVPENLQFFLIPYYMGSCFQKIMQQRQKMIQFAKKYIDDFIMLLNHYQILTNKQMKQFKASEQENYQVDRDLKISNFKENTQLKLKLENLEKLEERDMKETVMIQIQLCIIKSFDDLLVLKQEFQILEYREKLLNDKDAKAEHEKMMNRPIPKLSVMKVPKQEEHVHTDQCGHQHELHKTLEEVKEMKITEQRQLTEQEQVAHDKQFLCHYHQQEQHVKREQLKSQVFQATNQPTCTLDELAEVETLLMEQNTASMKQADQREKEKEEQNSDDEQLDSDKKWEERQWDDWKDAHHKGEGNMKGRK